MKQLHEGVYGNPYSRISINSLREYPDQAAVRLRTFMPLRENCQAVNCAVVFIGARQPEGGALRASGPNRFHRRDGVFCNREVR